MNVQELRTSYLAHEAKAKASEAAEPWRQAESKAVVFAEGEFLIDREAGRVKLFGPFQADLAADESVCGAAFEPGWIAFVEAGAGKHAAVVGQGDPFSEQAASILPSIGGLVCAVPACMLAERMEAMQIKASGANRAQRRALEKEARRK